MARTTNNAVAMDHNLLDYREPSSWNDVMFDEQRSRKPWKKVFLAVFLCLAGSAMLTAGICLWYKGTARDGSATALLVLGSVCFLPGFYHTRIAYLAWKGVQGYTLDSIPDF
eukprot:gene2578-2880_t